MNATHVSQVKVEPTPSPDRRSRALRRVAIAVFFASVAVNAGLGVAALVAGDFGRTQGRVLGTSLAVTACLMLALVCVPAWERRLLGPAPVIGAGAGAVGFALVVVMIWSDEPGATLGKSMGTALTLGVASGLASLLVLPRLAPRHRYALTAAVALEAVAAAMLIVQVWVEIDSTVYLRAFGVVAVLFAAVAVSIPVLHRVGLTAGAVAAADTVRFCPFCGAELPTDAGRAPTCAGCGRSFSVRAGR